MLRYKMRKLIKLLENNDFRRVQDEVLSPGYRRALLALESAGYVKIQRTWGGAIAHVWLLDSHVGYQLSRRDVWVNRFWGFAVGVATSVAAHYIIVLIGLLRASR